MAAPRFDFSRSTKETETPRSLPAFGSESGAGGFWAYVFFGSMIVGLVAVILWQRRQQKRQQAHSTAQTWDRLADICAEHNLTPEEQTDLQRTLREAAIVNPDRVMLSRNRFDAAVAPALTERCGEAACGRIRQKLFLSAAKETPRPATFGGTHDLHAGQKLRLHFATIPGTFTCTVINVSKQSFVITLPVAGERHIHPRKDEKVEGYMELGNTLYSFESQVAETFLGGVFACRIVHAKKVKQSNQRSATRIRMAQHILFSHFPGANVETGQIDLESLQSQLTQNSDGVLRDISTGGCAIVTQTAKRIDVGDFVQLTTRLLPDEPEHSILGQIIHISPVPVPEGGGQVLHVQFLGLDEDAQGTLTRAVHQLRQEGV